MLFWTRNGLTFGWIGILCNWSAHFSYASALWKGYIDIDVQGTYTFKLTSDDGSWLYIDDTLVIDNGGIHAIKSVTSTVALEKGKHKALIKNFDEGGCAVFDLLWVPPGGVEKDIPEER